MRMAPEGIAAGFLGAILAALLLAGPAQADPQGWWDDRPLPLDPNLAVVRAAGTVGGPSGRGPGVFVLILDRDGLELLLSATFDGGCTFCEPVPIGFPPLQTGVEARLAVGVDTGGRPVVALALHANDNIWYGAARGADFSCPGLPSAGAFAWAELARPTSVNWLDVKAARPSDPTAPLQIHVAWTDWTGRAGIFYRNDLDGDLLLGGPGDGPERIVTAGYPDLISSGPFVMSADSHGLTPQDAGVSVLFGPGLLASGGDGLRLIRSSDSGANWSGDGAPPATPPVDPPVEIGLEPWSCKGAAAAGPPGAPTWQVVACGGSPSVTADAALRRAPALEDPGWSATDPDPFLTLEPEEAFVSVDDVAVVPDPLDPGEASAFVFWWDESVGFGENWVQVGRLSPSLPANPDFSGSGPVRLTGLHPPRTAGEAFLGEVAVTDREELLFFSWDDKGTGWRTYTKRWDGESLPVTGPAASTLPGCPPRVQLTWDLEATPPHCDLRRVVVVHGENSGGPYPASLAVPVGAGGVVVEGLHSSTESHFLVLVEDEAGNLAPSGVDPSVNSAENASWQVSATTVVCACAAGARVGPGTGPLETCAGEEVVLDGTASFVEGCPDPEFAWSRDGVPLQPGLVTSDAPTGTATYTLTAVCLSVPDCRHETSFDVLAHPLPTAVIAPTEDKYCMLDSDERWRLDLDATASGAVLPAGLPVDHFDWRPGEGACVPFNRAETTLDIPGRRTEAEIDVTLWVWDSYGCVGEPARRTLQFEGEAYPPELRGFRVRRLAGDLRFQWAPLSPAIATAGLEVMGLAHEPGLRPTRNEMRSRGQVVATAPDGSDGASVPLRDLPPADLLYLRVRGLAPCSGRPGSL